jgi:hypothetical protein
MLVVVGVAQVVTQIGLLQQAQVLVDSMLVVAVVLLRLAPPKVVMVVVVVLVVVERVQECRGAGVLTPLEPPTQRLVLLALEVEVVLVVLQPKLLPVVEDQELLLFVIKHKEDQWHIMQKY